MEAEIKTPEPPIRPGLFLEMELKKHNITQREAGRVIGVSQSYVNYLVSGFRPYHIMYAVLFAELLDIPVQVFIDVINRYDLYVAQTDDLTKMRLEKIRTYKRNVNNAK